MVRIFVYSNRLVSRELVVTCKVDTLSLEVFKARVSFRISDILRLFDKDDMQFTLGNCANVDDVDKEPELYIVIDTDDNLLIEKFCTVLSIVLSFA